MGLTEINSETMGFKKMTYKRDYKKSPRVEEVLIPNIPPNLIVKFDVSALMHISILNSNCSI